VRCDQSSGAVCPVISPSGKVVAPMSKVSGVLYPISLVIAVNSIFGESDPFAERSTRYSGGKRPVVPVADRVLRTTEWRVAREEFGLLPVLAHRHRRMQRTMTGTRLKSRIPIL
jgi:hypothetical protein